MTVTTATPAPTTTAGPMVRIAKGGGIGLGLALLANLAIFLIARAGSPIQIVLSGETTASDLPIAAVVGASIVPLLAGAGALWVLERVRADGFRIWTVLAAGFTVLSVGAPLTLDIDNRSKAALAAMHVATGAAAIAGQFIARRSTV